MYENSEICELTTTVVFVFKFVTADGDWAYKPDIANPSAMHIQIMIAIEKLGVY